MRVSSICNFPAFSAGGSTACKRNESKSSINPAIATGYLALGSFGGAMISGINKKIKLHKAFCYISLAAAAGHAALVSTHKHAKE